MDTSPEASTINFFEGMANAKNYKLFGGNEEDGNRIPNENENEGNDQTEVTFGFSILDEMKNVVIKNTFPSILSHFHGMSTEDPYSFLFEFDILCISFNYVNDA